MKRDTHVHTFHSGRSTINSLQRILRECCNTPEDVYRIARARGLSLVAITDHDEISGAFTLAHLDDAIVVCEERFHQNLLFDLVARPARTLAQVPRLAA